MKSFQEYKELKESLDPSMVKLQDQMQGTGISGDKILVHLPGQAKPKTLAAGSTSQESREMDYNKQDRFRKKIAKFIQENPTFDLTMKMSLSGKWREICKIEVFDGKVTSQEWYM